MSKVPEGIMGTALVRCPERYLCLQSVSW